MEQLEQLEQEFYHFELQILSYNNDSDLAHTEKLKGGDVSATQCGFDNPRNIGGMIIE